MAVEELGPYLKENNSKLIGALRFNRCYNSNYFRYLKKVFSDNSYGFRPQRSAQDAARKVVSYYNQGYHYVVDLALKFYFDNVNCDLLIKFVESYISAYI